MAVGGGGAELLPHNPADMKIGGTVGALTSGGRSGHISRMSLEMRMWVAVMVAGFAMSSGHAIAGEGVFDWEGAESSCAPVWEADGLRVANARGTICATKDGFASNGTWTSNDVADLSIKHVNGAAFTPVSIDLAEYSPTLWDAPVEFIGYKSDGSRVSASFELDGVIDGPGGLADFQNYVFPADFEDIMLLEVPSIRWQFDNLRFRTVIPPPLPTDQRLGNGFYDASLLFSKSIHDDTLVIGSDFEFVSGFRPASPTKSRVLPPEGTLSLGYTYLPCYDRADKRLYFGRSGALELSSAKAGFPLRKEVDLLMMSAAGFTVERLSMPRAAGGRMLFLGTIHGDDSFSIFKRENGIITAIVTPESLLPDAGDGAEPHYFPRGMAVDPHGFAFDTSLSTQSYSWTLLAAFDGGAIQSIVSEGQWIPVGELQMKVISFGEFSFTDEGNLRVRAELTAGDAWLSFSATGLTEVQWIAASASPENVGKHVDGELIETTIGIKFLHTFDEVFREHEGRFYRVIGAGDRINGETVSLVEFKAARATSPLRVIVEVRYESAPATAHLIELSLDTPSTLPPRFGQTVLHEESGDLFIPLSHLTFGSDYWLQSSDDLENWSDLRSIGEVRPLQYIVIPEVELASPSFFRVIRR
jgi:hypothetical protein